MIANNNNFSMLNMLNSMLKYFHTHFMQSLQLSYQTDIFLYHFKDEKIEDGSIVPVWSESDR